MWDRSTSLISWWSLRRIYVGDVCTGVGERCFATARVRMRGAEYPPASPDHVLQDGLGFKQVVACVGIKNFTPHRSVKRRSSRGHSGSPQRASASSRLSLSVTS